MSTDYQKAIKKKKTQAIMYEENKEGKCSNTQTFIQNDESLEFYQIAVLPRGYKRAKT